MKRITQDEFDEILRLHKLWEQNQPDGVRAVLDDTDLSGLNMDRASLNWASLNRAFLNMASLDGASMVGASLDGALMNGIQGNMAEIKSAHFDRWPIAWFQPRGLSVHLQIGCQQHDLGWWEAATDEQIDCLDSRALGWWRRYRDIVLGLVKASPAVVSGGVGAEAGE